MISAIKSFILDGQALAAKKEENKVAVKKERAIPHVSIVLENDSDFVLRKTSARTSSLLVCILSQGMFYIKDEKSGELKPVTKSSEFEHFLYGTDVNYLNNKDMEFKQLKYRIYRKNMATVKISNFMYAAIIHSKIVQELVNHKIFLSEECIGSPNTISFLTNKSIKDIAAKIIFAQENLIQEGYELGSSTFEKVFNFFSQLEKVGVNFDKIKYNTEKINILSRHNQDWWKPGWYSDDKMSSCIKLGNLDFNRFIDYLLYLYTVEGVSANNSSRDSDGFGYGDYYDYLDMQIKMYGRILEKYPQNWLTEHHKLANTFSSWKKIHENDIMLERSKAVEQYQYSNDTYTVVIPKTSNDVVDEGCQLCHCVGSYVDRIVNGETNIVFVRYKNTPQESLVTVEIKNGTIVQYRGKYNRSLTEEEMDFLREWSKKVKLGLNV